MNWSRPRLLLTGIVSGILLIASSGCGSPNSFEDAELTFTGSGECRECHERFYEKWATSRHGTAMQPFSTSLPDLGAPAGPITIGKSEFEVLFEGDAGWVVETRDGQSRRYPIVQALGGKNVYYFLTALERGWLQVLPLAFDTREGAWFDTTASMVRHFRDRSDEAHDWRDRPLTFNTACFGCHVSQMAKNYDPKTDSYLTVWAEPGVNCETCHGPAAEHVRVSREAGKGNVPADVRIIQTAKFDNEQTNSMCGPCHAKMYPVSDSFTPGELFFDHFGLHTMEHPDFYPDGRDLGENYTYTQWLMNPCAQSGQLDCVDCHTSSGRDRHSDTPDNACMPCHQEYVMDPAAHSFHPAENEGSRCVSCHMPKTSFARMVRHDHSLLAPTPATTVLYDSPNACNICHADQSPEWADQWVKKWYGSDYQQPVLQRAGLVDAARREDWSQLDKMLEYLESPDRDQVFVASLLRLLENCPDTRKWPFVRRSTRDASPLVRAAALSALSSLVTEENRSELVQALDDRFRTVRMAAAASLAAYPLSDLGQAQVRKVESALSEYELSLRNQADEWAAQYTLGNHLMTRNQGNEAVEAFRRSQMLRPDLVPPLVNESLALARLGRHDEAERSLRKALELDPSSSAVQFNLGLLEAERGRIDSAERHLRAALELDRSFAEAAFNLGVILGEQGKDESLEFCRTASRLRPESDRYVYTLAFYLVKFGQVEEATQVLTRLTARGTSEASVYSLLADLYARRGLMAEARGIYAKAAQNDQLSPGDRSWFSAQLGPE